MSEGQQQETSLIKPDVGQEVLPADRFTADELRSGSTVMNLEAAVGIQVGKIKPVGYDEAASFFRQDYGKTTDAHCAWLLSEAVKAGKVDDLERDFPQVRLRARRIVDHMQQNNPHDVAAIIGRLQRQDYSIQRVRDAQANAAKLAEIILGKPKK